MGRHLKEAFSAETILAHMKPGRLYRADEVADDLDHPLPLMRSLLSRMVSDGKLRKQTRADRHAVYLLPQEAPAVEPEPLTTSIAAPIAPPDLTRVWDGDDGRKQFVMLAMSVRRYA